MKIRKILVIASIAVTTTAMSQTLNMATDEKRNVDAAALLRNALKDISPIQQLMKPTICVETQKTISSKEYKERKKRKLNDDMVGIRYMFKIELDREKYFKEVVPKLKSILEQISLEPPREFSMTPMKVERGSQYQFDSDREEFLKYSGEGRSMLGAILFR
ncbi:MAG: hypothetical protein IKC27_02680 [Kiritimatiellae bacterium]|nr:hypothetical protein [Kiritimatiellia bacterium]